MIEVSQLVKHYSDRKILQDLTFSVKSKRICGFLGPNGSGKSTTMDILAGLLGPSSGTVEVCGYDVIKYPRMVKSCVGYLPDNPPLYKEMYVQDFIEFSAKLHNLRGNECHKAVADIIEECDIGDVKNRLIGNLSKGYRQRVALSSALVHKPKVLILDEPTEGLDPSQILLIRNLIKSLSKERTVILSSHILPEVQATCDDVIIIVQGEIRAQFKLDDDAADDKQYTFRVLDKHDKLVTWFKEKSYTKSVHSDSENLDVTVVFKKSSEYKLELIVKDLVMANFALVGIQENSHGLEEIFFDVLQNSAQNLTP